MGPRRHPSDVTDEQWALIEPFIPVYPGGRPRKTDVRDVLGAILYIPRTGCQWRYLPEGFPPRSATWRDFDPEVVRPTRSITTAVPKERWAG